MVKVLPPGVVAPLSETARSYASEASAENTRRAYQAAWADFVERCEAGGHTPLPVAPEVVGSFLAAQAGTTRQLASPCA